MINRYGCIYKITNKINGKVYIGMTTKTGKSRFKKHIQSMSNSDRYFYRALKKYNKDNFKVEEIFSCFTKKDLVEFEAHFIEYYKSNISEKGYNLTTGGEGGTFNKEVNEKRASKLRGKKRPRYIAEKVRKKLLGRKMTPEQIKKSVENRKKKSGYKGFNKKHSEKTKKLISKKIKELGLTPHTSPIQLIDIKTNQKWKFNSLAEAERTLKNVNAKTLSNYINQGNTKYKNYFIQRLDYTEEK